MFCKHGCHNCSTLLNIELLYIMQHTRFLQNFLRPQNYLNHIQNLIYICIYSVHQSVALWRQRLSWHYEQQHLTFCISVSGTVKTKTELALWTAASHVPLKGRKRNLSIHKEILFLENINKVMKVKGKSSNFSSHWQMLTGKSGSQPPSSRTCKEVQWPKLVL